jgi:hypothetical protein
MTTTRPRTARRRARQAIAAPALDQAIAEAERTALVVWRGERLAYSALPGRIAHTSSRGERHGLFSGYLEAVEAINPLREQRLEALATSARESGYDDLVGAAGEMAGYDPTVLWTELRRFGDESETVYFAALRRYLALIDIEQGDATVADLWHVQEGSGWNQWFDERRTATALSRTLGGLGLTEPDDAGAHDAVSPWSAAAARLRAVGIGAGGSTAGSDAGVDRGQRAAAPAVAAVLGSLLMEPAWLTGELGMGDTEVVGFTDFAAFTRLGRIRRDAALLGYELQLHRSDDAAVRRAYFSGMLGFITGVTTPEPLYLAQVGRPWDAGARVRAEMLAAAIGDALRARHGPAWWRVSEAGAELRELASMSTPEDAVARLGYDRLDWRPVLRQIRTQLIGEMSGYGGPNITTRAGTRKV